MTESSQESLVLFILYGSTSMFLGACIMVGVAAFLFERLRKQPV
jgi:hypothetical protein